MAGKLCIEGHDSVRFVDGDLGAGWVCLRCRTQVGNCSKNGDLWSQERVNELVDYALKLREEEKRKPTQKGGGDE